MQLLTNLFVLAQQLSLTSGLRVIDNGLGPPVWSSEENGVADYALQAIDKKAALPSQVQAMCHFWYFSCSVHHLLVCNNRCFTVQPCLLSTTPSVWESLDYTILGPYAWQRGSHIQINGNVIDPYVALWSLTVSPVDIEKVPKSFYVSFRCISKFHQINWNHQIDCYHVCETVKVDDM